MENGQTTSRNVATLADVEEQSDFQMLYSNQGLSTLQDRIAYIMENTTIRKIRTERQETPEERLDGLEELLLNFPELLKNN